MQSIRSLLAIVTLAACGASSLGAQARAGDERPVWPDEGPRTWAPRPTVDDITAERPPHPPLPIADDSMIGRRIGEPGNFKGDRLHRARVQALRAQARRRRRHLLPGAALRADGRRPRDASRLVVAGAPLAAETDWIPTAPSAANGLQRQAALDNVPTVFAGRWGDTRRARPGACSAARSPSSSARRAPRAARQRRADASRQLRRRARQVRCGRCGGRRSGARARRPPPAPALRAPAASRTARAEAAGAVARAGHRARRHERLRASTPP